MIRHPPTSPPFPSTPLFRSPPPCSPSPRSAVLHRPDDLAEQRRELVFLLLGQAGADKCLAHVEGREQPLDHRDALGLQADQHQDRKSTRLNSSHSQISYAVF